jgi:hypothetical protein
MKSNNPLCGLNTIFDSITFPKDTGSQFPSSANEPMANHETLHPSLKFTLSR